MAEAPPNTRIPQLITFIGLSISLLANVGGVLGIFGVTGSLTLGYMICALGLLVLAMTLITRYVVSLRAHRNELLKIIATASSNEIQMSKILSIDSTKIYLKSAEIKEIHVLGSGTETYFIVLTQLFNEGVLHGGITLHIGFRIGTNPLRYSKLKEYEAKWRSLAQKYNLRIYYYPYQDFFFLIRGIVFNDDLGLVGFYHRVKDDTLGVDEPVVIAKRTNPISLYLIKNFLKVFECLSAHDSIASAIEDHSKRDAALSK